MATGERPQMLAINRLAVRWEKEHARELHAAAPAQSGPSGSRASSRLLPGIAIEDWTLHVAAWQKVVEPDARLQAASERVSKAQRELLVNRFGWGDGPPRMLGECAKLLKVSSIKIARMERDALAATYAVLASVEGLFKCQSPSARINKRTMSARAKEFRVCAKRFVSGGITSGCTSNSGVRHIWAMAAAVTAGELRGIIVVSSSHEALSMPIATRAAASRTYLSASSSPA